MSNPEHRNGAESTRTVPVASTDDQPAQKVLVLHAYSAANKGDGLLVEETLDIVRQACGDRTQITVASSDPDSFAGWPVSLVKAKPGKRGYDRDYLNILRNLNSYDLVIGVGGGYLRTGHPVEALKCLLVMGPQLFAAARSSVPTVYLPQSIGPIRLGFLPLMRAQLGRIDRVYVRDDRSKDELGLPNVFRSSDLALLSKNSVEQLKAFSHGDDQISGDLILTTRALRGEKPPLVIELKQIFDQQNVPVKGYIQSSVGGNNDKEAQEALTPGNLISPEEYLSLGEFSGQKPKVVVAVRLHAAIMALRAGHYVIHLSYERKGFGAFKDLGLERWLHNVNAFDPFVVYRQVRDLQENAETRTLYRRCVSEALDTLQHRRGDLIEDIVSLESSYEGTLESKGRSEQS